jgi:hypothetical protein
MFYLLMILHFSWFTPSESFAVPDALQDHCDGRIATEIVLCFPDGSAEMPACIHSYLPIRSVGFKFIIQVMTNQRSFFFFSSVFPY